MMSEGGGRGVGTELDVPQHTCVYTQTKNTHSHLPGGVVVSDLLKQEALRLSASTGWSS